MFKLLALFLFPLALFSTPLIIGISGGTGSGKTTIAEKIKASFPNDAIIIAQDAYYKDLSHLSPKERDRVNFDHPKSVDFELLKNQLIDLKKGKAVIQPSYDFITHTRTNKTNKIEPAKIIIVEGILLFAMSDIRDLFDFKIYMDTDDDVRVLRRIERDMHDRGRDFDSIKEQYQATVKPMHLAFVEPNKKHADIIVPAGGKNEKAIQMIASRLKEACEPQSDQVVSSY